MLRPLGKIAILFVFLLLPSFSPVHAGPATPAVQPEVARGQIPDWLVSRSMPADGPALGKRARDGISFLMADWQVRAYAGGYDSYYRITRKVIDRSGLEEAGKIEEEYDPRIEHVTVNFVRIIRDGRVIDLTRQVELRTVQRETELEDGITNGRLTILGNISDVRVGDIVDYAATYRTDDLIWPGEMFLSFHARMSVPVGVRAVRISWPADRPPLRFKSINTDMSFQQKTEGGQRIWEWVALDAPETDSENDVPKWFPQFGRINVSTASSWAEVANWASRIYAGDDSLNPEFEAKLADIARRWPKPADRLTEVTRYLRDNIRYVGEEMGEASYVPRRPHTVLERGYGDCKDKSLLLAISLRRLGIDAWPALVSTDIGRGLPDRLPSPTAFNHVIVRAVLDGTVLWIDPTLTHQGGRGLAMVPSDLGYALPIRADQRALEPITGYDKRAGRMRVVERFAVDEKADPAVTLHVETVYTDALADWIRSSFSKKPASAVAKDNLDFYHKRFAGLVESQPVRLEDDLDGNRVTMIEDYRLALADFKKAGLLEKFVTRAYALTDVLPDRQNSPRRNPLVLSYDVDREQVIELTAKDRELGLPDPIDDAAEGVAFKRSVSRTGDTVKMIYTLTTGPAAQVAPDRAAAVYAISDKIADETGMEFYISQSEKPSEKPVSPLADLIAPVREEMGKAGALMQKDDEASLVGALTIFNTLAAKTARPSELAGLIDGMKGLVLAKLGRYQPARSALESSIGQFHGNGEIIYVLAAIQLDQKETLPAIETLKLAGKYHPDTIKGLTLEFLRPLWQQMRALDAVKRTAAFDDVDILLAQSGWQQEPMTADGDGIISRAVQALVRRGAVDDARKLFDKSTSAQAALILAVDNRYKALWPQLEQLVRDHFRSRIAREVAVAATAAAKTPDDFRTMTRYLHVLRFAGEPSKAVEAGRALAAQTGRIEATGDAAFWFVNEYAGALGDAGMDKESVVQLDSLMKLGLDAYPGLVSQAINRAEQLNATDRPADALGAFTALDENHQKKANLYGRMWIWSGRICALHTLGRPAEAGPLLKQINEGVEANIRAAVEAAACAGDKDRVETLLLKLLDDPDERSRTLMAFSRFAKAPTQSLFNRRFAAVIDEVRNRPAVAAKLKAFGRTVDFAGSRAYLGFY